MTKTIKLRLDEFDKLNLDIKSGDIIFLYWDLGSGKTTLSKYIINKILGFDNHIKSPTYIYYNKYWENVFHFDLYRLKDYSEFINIWAEEIVDNEENICIIEWPELIEKNYKPTISIKISKTEDDAIREFEITK